MMGLDTHIKYKGSRLLGLIYHLQLLPRLCMKNISLYSRLLKTIIRKYIKTKHHHQLKP